MPFVDRNANEVTISTPPTECFLPGDIDQVLEKAMAAAKRKSKKQRLQEVVNLFKSLHGDRPFTSHDVGVWATLEGLWPVPTQRKADADFAASWDIRFKQVQEKIAKGAA